MLSDRSDDELTLLLRCLSSHDVLSMSTCASVWRTRCLRLLCRLPACWSKTLESKDVRAVAVEMWGRLMGPACKDLVIASGDSRLWLESGAMVTALAHARHCPNLRSISTENINQPSYFSNLGGVRCSPTGFRSLIRLVPQLRFLRLELRGGLTPASEADMLRELALHCPYIEAVRLSSSPDTDSFDSNRARAPLASWTALTNLTELDVCAVTDLEIEERATHVAQEAVRLPEVARMLQHLATLDISCQRLSATTLEAFAKHARSLTDLQVDESQIESPEQLGAWLKLCPALKKLSLYSVKKMPVETLSIVARSCPAVETLMIGGVGDEMAVTDEGIADVCQHMLSLKCLFIGCLHSNDILADISLQQLWVGLCARASSLESVELDGNKCYDSLDDESRLADLNMLAATVKACTRLLRVKLSEEIDVGEVGDETGPTTSDLTREVRRGIATTLRARGGDLNYELVDCEGNELEIDQLEFEY